MSQLFETEDTPEGPQTLIPGVQAVTTRERLQQCQERPLSGGSEPCNGGLFDDSARRQLDMLDLM